MGNQLSTPQQRKLAKPKTNNSAPNQRLPSASQVVELPTPPVTISNIGEADMATIGTSGDRRSLPGAFQKLRDRTWSFGGNDSIDPFGDDDSTVGSLGAIVSGVKDRISRSGSLSSSRMSSARTSLTRLTSLGGLPRVSLVIEPGAPNAGATGLVRQEIEENARANELALQHISAPSPTSEYSPCPSCTPIRRRSLLTPGIATRGRPSNILRKAPPPGELQTQADRDYYFNSSPTHPDTFDLVEEERRSSEQRAATPCDQEFGVLGVFKRGTLRITNGAASPAPSQRTLSHALGSTPSPISGESDEEYFSASEGGGSLENEHTPISEQAIPRRGGGSIDAGPGGPIQEENSELDGLQKSPGISTNQEWQRSSSPLQDDMYFREELVEVLNETSAISLSPPEVPVRSPDRASKIAQQYIQELAPLVSRRSSSVTDTSSSPPGVTSAGARGNEVELLDGPLSPRKTEPECLTTGPTSNLGAVRADTFDDEGIEVSPVLQKISDITHLVQRWSVAKHTSDCNACHSDIQPPSTASSPAAADCPPCSESPPRQPMPSRTLSKADSGYDSQHSVKSVATGSKTTQQDSESSDCSERSASISNANSNSRLWTEQGFEVTHERPFSRHPNAAPSSKPLQVLRPSPLPADAAETTVIMIPPPKSKFRGLRKSLPPGTSQQVPPSPEFQSLRTPRRMLQPPIPPPRSSSVTVRTYRNISQAHIPPSTPVDTTSKPVQRRSNHLPLIPKSSESPELLEPVPRPLTIRNGTSPPYRSYSVITRPSTDRWQSDPATGPNRFRQRGRLTNRSSHKKEAPGLIHERSRTRSRSQGPISRVEPGITDRCQSMYAGKNPLVLPSC